MIPEAEWHRWRAMAREILKGVPTDPFKDDVLLQDVVGLSMKFAVEAEREACAKVAEDHDAPDPWKWAQEIADKIRSR